MVRLCRSTRHMAVIPPPTLSFVVQYAIVRNRGIIDGRDYRNRQSVLTVMVCLLIYHIVVPP